MRLRSLVGVGVLAIAAAAASVATAGPGAAVDPSSSIKLTVSLNPDRSGAVDLVDGAAFVDGETLYVSATVTSYSPKRVYFRIDDSPFSDDRTAPYDMTPLDTSQLAPGLHEIAGWAVVNQRAGDYIGFTASVMIGAPPPTTTTTTLPPPPPPPTRDAFLWPFAASSPWNTPIGSGAGYTDDTDARTINLIDPQYAIYINAASYSMPMVRASASDPVVAVSYTWANVPPYGDGTVQYRIPSNAQPANGTDRHLHVLDPDGRTLHEAWDFRRTGPKARAGKYARTDLQDSGLYPFAEGCTPESGCTEGNHGTRAYGGSGVAGLIRTWEIEAGVIRHSVALALVNDQLEQGWIWPASSEDSTASYYAGTIPMGSLVAIPSGVNLATLGLSDRGMILARALQDYGAYVTDRSANLAFYAEPDAESLLAEMRADLGTIRAQLRVITNNAPGSVGGGGTPPEGYVPPPPFT